MRFSPFLLSSLFLVDTVCGGAIEPIFQRDGPAFAKNPKRAAAIGKSNNKPAITSEEPSQTTASEIDLGPELEAEPDDEGWTRADKMLENYIEGSSLIPDDIRDSGDRQRAHRWLQENGYETPEISALVKEYEDDPSDSGRGDNKMKSPAAPEAGSLEPRANAGVFFIAELYLGELTWFTANETQCVLSLIGITISTIIPAIRLWGVRALVKDAGGLRNLLLLASNGPRGFWKDVFTRPNGRRVRTWTGPPGKHSKIDPQLRQPTVGSHRRVETDVRAVRNSLDEVKGKHRKRKAVRRPPPQIPGSKLISSAFYIGSLLGIAGGFTKFYRFCYPFFHAWVESGRLAMRGT